MSVGKMAVDLTVLSRYVLFWTSPSNSSKRVCIPVMLSPLSWATWSMSCSSSADDGVLGP